MEIEADTHTARKNAQKLIKLIKKEYHEKISNYAV